jgi:hypothetical protein
VQPAWLDEPRLAEWMSSENILQRLLGSNLHQKEFVLQVVAVIRFLTKAASLSLQVRDSWCTVIWLQKLVTPCLGAQTLTSGPLPQDIDLIWGSAMGKHEAIVANIHMLLGEIAEDLSPEHLDHLFQLLERDLDHANANTPREFQVASHCRPQQCRSRVELTGGARWWISGCSI